MQQAIIRAAREESRARAGSRALSVFARVLSARIMRAHRGDSLGSRELEARLGWAAKASLRVATANLCELGVLERAGQRKVTTALTPAGRDLLPIANALEGWLSGSSFEAPELFDDAARGIVRALVAGWDTMIVHALAERRRSLAELNSQTPECSYPALKRRFAKLRTATLIECEDDQVRSPEYTVTTWLRRAVGPLMLAAAWERKHLPGATQLDRHDLEAALLLSLPLVKLPARTSGKCVLAAPMTGSNGGKREKSSEPDLAAVSLEVAKGKIVSLSTSATSTPGTWALGSGDAWLDVIAEGRVDNLRIRGADTDFATGLIGRLFKSLF